MEPSPCGSQRLSFGPPLVDPEVNEVAPTAHLSSKTHKHKQTELPEIIDVDGCEDSKDRFVVDIKGKGKAVQIESSGSFKKDSEDQDPSDCLPELQALFDNLSSSDGPAHHNKKVDLYEKWGVYFDKMDVPADVEMPLSSLSRSAGYKTKSKSENASTHAWYPSNGDAFHVSASLPRDSAVPQTEKGENKSSAAKATTLSKHKDFFYQVPLISQPHDINAGHFVQPPSSYPFGTIGYNSMGEVCFPYAPPEWQEIVDHHNLDDQYGAEFEESPSGAPDDPTISMGDDSSNISIDVNEYLLKFHQFKRFDTVEDYSDHKFSKSTFPVKQLSKSWAKKIQDEWKMLENYLPDMIYVRVYESRIDLMRAVIIGAEGTPYHDGLFFFDVHFPDYYPNVPPNVYYHSKGFRLNPNLYGNGKVCLSLLGTWAGSKSEQWIPGTSNMLQVLLSIQALILNKKPYFNEPGYESMIGQQHGELSSQRYNEDTFILSLKTMIKLMKNPPKNFEELVWGHFYSRAHDVLGACKAYIEGAPVGCVMKGGVQDVDESESSSGSNYFKRSLPRCVELLVKQFKLIGVEDCERFVVKAEANTGREA